MRRINLILSGGFGTRLWPISQPEMPKQFLPYFPNKSLFQHCIERNESIADEFLIVTNKNHAVLAEPILNESTKKDWKLMLEPAARNSAAAIAWACNAVNPDSIMIVTPSDQIINNISSYHSCVDRACELAEQGAIVTIGIQPESPETGFGYIQSEGEEVISFKEKPNLETAISYLESGNYFWNAGIFVFKASTLLDELKVYDTELHSQIMELNENNIDQKYPTVKDISIDYAIMEKSKLLKVVSGDLNWSDLGSLESFFGYFKSNNQQHPNLKGETIWSEIPGAFIENKDMMLIIANGQFLTLPYGSGQEVKKLREAYLKQKPE